MGVGGPKLETTVLFRTINSASSRVRPPFVARPLKITFGELSPSLAIAPLTVGASTLHSADVPAPVCVCRVEYCWPVVLSVRPMPQEEPDSCAIVTVTLSPGETVIEGIGVSNAGRISHHGYTDTVFTAAL